MTGVQTCALPIYAIRVIEEANKPVSDVFDTSVPMDISSAAGTMVTQSTVLFDMNTLEIVVREAFQPLIEFARQLAGQAGKSCTTQMEWWVDCVWTRGLIDFAIVHGKTGKIWSMLEFKRPKIVDLSSERVLGQTIAELLASEDPLKEHVGITYNAITNGRHTHLIARSAAADKLIMRCESVCIWDHDPPRREDCERFVAFVTSMIQLGCNSRREITEQ